jgi:hypothetical protein
MALHFSATKRTVIWLPLPLSAPNDALAVLQEAVDGQRPDFDLATRGGEIDLGAGRSQSGRRRLSFAIRCGG